MRRGLCRGHRLRGPVMAGLLLLSAPAAIRAQEPPTDAATVARMQREIQELKDQLRALKAQVEALTRAAPGQAAASGVPPAVETTEPLPAPPAPPRPFTGAGTGAGNVFNPAISGVFQGIGVSSFHHDRDDDGFNLSEAEIGLLAAIDPFARVDLFLAFSGDGEAEIEEGYTTFLTLPGGLQARAGRFKSAFGKWNLLHNHAFTTVDRPVALSSFFGEESLTGDGASLSWLIPGTASTFIETVTEVASTQNETSFTGRRRDLMFLQRLGAVFTLSPTATLGAGASAVAGTAGSTQALIDDIDAAGLAGVVTPSESLSSNVFGADLTWKWKPLQAGLYRSFLWQTELMRSVRQVEELDPSGELLRGTLRRFGGYSYAEYQFARRWRAGVRYDYSQFPDDDRALQQGISGVLRIQPSEFQEFRFQFTHTGRNDAAAARYDDIGNDNEIFVEWIPVFGAHGAHPF